MSEYKQYGMHWGSKNCIRCKENFSYKNLFTKLGKRESNMSGMCEICFEISTLSPDAPSREEIIEKLDLIERFESLKYTYQLFRQGETPAQAIERIEKYLKFESLKYYNCKIIIDGEIPEYMERETQLKIIFL